MRASVLLVEDEPAIGSLVRTYLEHDGLDVRWCRTTREALGALAARSPALVVLDLGLPDGDGLDVARAAAPGVPVLVLTARAGEADRLAGFEAGVDDYVIKPFSPREVVARVRAILRRAGPPEAAAAIALGPLEIDVAGHAAWVDGTPVELTAKELALLAHLAGNAGRVLTRDALLEAVWGFAAPGQSRTVDQHVAQLRAKLRGAVRITTVRGVGYRIDAA